MIDEQVDKEFKRITDALVSRAPDGLPIDTGTRRRQRPWTAPIRAGSVAFAAALVIGAATLAILAVWGPEESSPASGGSRWDWILAGTAATDDPELRLADPTATPEAQFDYAQLGVEQRLVILPGAAVPEVGVADQASLAPFVHVGGVEGTVIVGYLFWSPGSLGPMGADDPEGSAVPVICLTIGSTAGPSSIGCHEARDPLPSEGLIALVEGGPTAAGVPQGRVIVALLVPRATAVASLKLDDGRSFVQRPMVGVNIFVLTDLGTAGVASATAYDASGATLIFEDFSQVWANLPE